MKAQNMKAAWIQSFAILISVLALSVSACTKSKEERSMLNPDGYDRKADFEGKVFSMVRGIEEAYSKNDVGAIPGMSEDFGFVKARITETEIQFIQVYNPTNRAETHEIVASYAISSHVDIRREQNDFKETTHKTVENTERPWAQREYMRVDWTRPTNKRSRLSSFTDQPDVPTENVVLLERPKIDPNGHVSWLTEFSAEGASGWWGISPSSRVVARVHLMPVKASDYEPRNYRTEDFQRFGYFFTRQNIENPEKGLLDSELENNTFANLHNVCEAHRVDAQGKALSCATNKVTWHLTKNFPQKYLEVTRQAVAQWNDTFKAALNRTDDVVVLDETKAVDFVDPRYNTIAHYAPASPGGLLGVAQWASNPETGELIGVRATVYEDGIRGMLGWVDDIITMILQDEEIRHAFLATDAEVKERVDRLFSKSNSAQLKGADSKQLRMMLGLSPHPTKAAKSKTLSTSGAKAALALTPKASVREMRSDLSRKLREPMASSLARKQKLMKNAPELFATMEQSRAGGGMVAGFDEAFGLLGGRGSVKSRLPDLGGVEHLHDIGSSLKEERARMMNQAETGVHGAELVEEAALRYIKRILAKHPEAKDFQAQVSKIKEDVDRMTFYTTLVHEMGHTFGLRHNFYGSADSKHYHPEYNRLVKQIEAEKDLPAEQKTVEPADLEPYMFSSIMDYGGDFYSQIGGLGPYDKAAIRYAYNRSIDKEKDATVTANYKFCTDHQVNESILCRRFDKGRNVSEITFNLIEDYHTSYLLSHFRRDRANFERRARSYPMNALVRYFVPVRQVMDEFLYALVDAKSVAAGENECEMDYWRKSVDQGEIVNVCNAVEAEQNGVDPTALETFEAGLFNETGLRKNPTEYEAYGLADLLFANILAKQFFTEVLGSTTPGTYIAEPIGQDAFALQKLPEGKNLDESLSAFATERGLPTTPEFIGQLKGLVGEVKLGRYGKPLDSEWDETGSVPKQKSIGSFWDKYVAMIALGIKDLGVDKYYRRSMTGNAYAYPQTSAFTGKVLKAMITQKDRLMTVPFATGLGVLSATVEPALNLDMRAISTITALTDFISDSDESIADRMRVCSGDEQGCRAKFDQKVVEFATSSGQEIYRSVQTLNGDSISFALLTEAATLDKQRNEWVVKQQTASDVAAENIMKLAELLPARESLEKSLLALEIKELNQIVPVMLSADPKTMSMWNIVNILATRGDQLPLFNTIDLIQQSSGILNAAAQVLGASIEALDPAGQCKVPETAAPKEDPNTSKLPAVTTLSKILSGRKSHLNGTAAPAEGAAQAPPVENAKKLDCEAVLARRAVLMAAAVEFQDFASAIGGVLNTSVEAKVAPLRAKRATDELARAEANIKLIRKVSKATGLE